MERMVFEHSVADAGIGDSARVLGFERFQLDPAARELRLDGEPLRIQPKPFELLLYLIRNRERACTKSELLDHIWPGVFVSESALFSALRDLRRVLRRGASRKEHIRTVYGYGYRFATPVEPEGTPIDAMQELLHSWLVDPASRELAFRNIRAQKASRDYTRGSDPAATRAEADSPRARGQNVCTCPHSMEYGTHESAASAERINPVPARVSGPSTVAAAASPALPTSIAGPARTPAAAPHPTSGAARRRRSPHSRRPVR